MATLNRLVHTIQRSTKPKELFENICTVYLLTSKTALTRVVPVSKMTDSERAPLLLPKKHVGVDLVGWNASGDPVAVQCKFRCRTDRFISWKDCALFDSVYHRTGPWVAKILMTTASGVSFHGLKMKGESFVTRHDFENLESEQMTDIIQIAQVLST